MSRALGLVGIAALTLLSACKSSPCSDDERELPPNLAKLPVLDSESSVCTAGEENSGENAMIMRWGEDLAPVQTKLMVAMDAEGWGQTQCWVSGTQNPDEVCFEKGEEFLRASFQQGESNMVGIKRATIISHFDWYVRNP